MGHYLRDDLILNYLSGDDLSNPQKERLVDSLFALDFNYSPTTFFWQDLSALAREGRSIQLPANKVIKVLETYMNLVKKLERFYHPPRCQEEINRIKELIANYKKDTDYVGQR